VDARTFLAIEQTGEDLFEFDVAERLTTPGQFLFGGCGLAAGTVALETVTGRPLRWATAHYLSYAPLNHHVTVRTNVLAAGGHVTQARAVMYADDREILTVNAALGNGSINQAEPWVARVDVPAPHDCPQRVMPERYNKSIFNSIETRVAVGRGWDQMDGSPGRPLYALWVRLPGHLEPEAATLAIFGDFMAGGFSQPLGRNTMGRSLDNTIRIASLEPTEWVLLEMHLHAMVDGFGQGVMFLWSENGTLLATASQSISGKFWEAPAEDGSSRS